MDIFNFNSRDNSDLERPFLPIFVNLISICYLVLTCSFAQAHTFGEQCLLLRVSNGNGFNSAIYSLNSFFSDSFSFLRFQNESETNYSDSTCLEVRRSPLPPDCDDALDEMDEKDRACFSSIPNDYQQLFADGLDKLPAKAYNVDREAWKSFIKNNIVPRRSGRQTIIDLTDNEFNEIIKLRQNLEESNGTLEDLFKLNKSAESLWEKMSEAIPDIDSRRMAYLGRMFEAELQNKIDNFRANVYNYLINGPIHVSSLVSELGVTPQDRFNKWSYSFYPYLGNAPSIHPVFSQVIVEIFSLLHNDKGVLEKWQVIAQASQYNTFEANWVSKVGYHLIGKNLSISYRHVDEVLKVKDKRRFVISLLTLGHMLYNRCNEPLGLFPAAGRTALHVALRRYDRSTNAFGQVIKGLADYGQVPVFCGDRPSQIYALPKRYSKDSDIIINTFAKSLLP